MIYLYVFIYIFLFIYIYFYLFIFIYIFIYIYLFIYIFIYICTFLFLFSNAVYVCFVVMFTFEALISYLATSSEVRVRSSNGSEASGLDPEPAGGFRVHLFTSRGLREEGDSAQQHGRTLWMQLSLHPQMTVELFLKSNLLSNNVKSIADLLLLWLINLKWRRAFFNPRLSESSIVMRCSVNVLFLKHGDSTFFFMRSKSKPRLHVQSMSRKCPQSPFCCCAFWRCRRSFCGTRGSNYNGPVPEWEPPPPPITPRLEHIP